MIDSYKSISELSKGIYKELSSKFLSFAYPVESEEETKLILSDIKKEYFNARHHCFAYRIGADGELWRANDDGEPSFSAGKPILGQILSSDLSDILIVVVRYFGGTKLGVPGLIRAYKNAAADAIDNATIIEKIVTDHISISFDYPTMNQVMRSIKNWDADIKEQQFENNCFIKVSIRQRDIEGFINTLEKINGVDYN